MELHRKLAYETLAQGSLQKCSIRDWSISIGKGGGGSEQMGEGSLDFEPSQRGGSLNFELAEGGGSSYL